jgi:cytolysin (calcineurin-like family phosphatase)
MNPIPIPSEEGKQINVPGIPMVIRIYGRDTGGAVAVVESHDVPDGGSPLHRHHREDKTFRFSKATYEWTVGGRSLLFAS